MPIQINGFAGDHAGALIGREPYQALIALTSSDGGNGSTDWFDTVMIEGVEVYTNVHVTCLTSGAMKAFATAVEFKGDNGGVLSIGLTPYGSGAAWEPGVHLFSIFLNRLESDGPGWEASCTIATVIVPKKPGPKLKMTEAGWEKLATAGQTRFQPRIASDGRGLKPGR